MRGHNVSALFSEGYFSMKKGVLRSKISWLLLILYKLSENPKIFFWFFTVLWGNLEGVGTLCPPALKLYSKVPFFNFIFYQDPKYEPPVETAQAGWRTEQNNLLINILVSWGWVLYAASCTSKLFRETNKNSALTLQEGGAVKAHLIKIGNLSTF